MRKENANEHQQKKKFTTTVMVWLQEVNEKVNQIKFQFPLIQVWLLFLDGKMK